MLPSQTALRQPSTGESALILVERSDSLRGDTKKKMDTSDASMDTYRRSTIGEASTFRSAALARRWINSSRRNILRKDINDLSFGRNAMSDGAIPTDTTFLLKPETGTIPEGIQREFPDSPKSGSVAISTTQALKHIVFGKSVSVFLLLIPFAVLSHKLGWSANSIFWLNFLVMIPLAAILGDFTEEAALHTNETIGGLLNATFGNAVEVVVAIQALLANEIRVVQASMLGSIFSNLLLVLGCCFLFGGIKYKEQSFNSASATANMALLSLSSIALVLPTPFAEYYNIQDEHVLTISRFAAGFLLAMYIQLLVFQLYTHAHIFDDERNNRDNCGCTVEKTENDQEEEEEDEDEEATIPLSVALIGLALTTLAVTVFSDYLVSSIDDFCESSGISRTFVGLILLPIVGNAVEHITAVTVAMKDKMDLAMGVAVGSCTQISLFVVPLTVLVGWVVDKPMTLNFPHFEVILYVLSVFTVSICLSNGKGNWLEGSLLVTTYVMIAIGFWFENVINF